LEDLGLLFGGPVGLAVGVAVGGVMACEFEKHVWEKVLDAVKKENTMQPTIDSVSHYHD
jgi:hypothetical protein